MGADYAAVTEMPGTPVSAEGLRMAYTRYAVAAEHAAGADVLEVAAGAGLGLGMLARKARRVVAVDVMPAMVRRARSAYGARVPLAAADAAQLPFADASFDLVLLYEAIYYLPDPGRFLGEARRVLRPGGRLLLCSANRERAGFVRSPHSHAYLGAAELAALLERHGFRSVEIHGAFPARALGTKERVALWGFSAADRLHLIPRSLEGRARFKRLVYGDLLPLPTELAPGALDPEPLRAWPRDAPGAFRVIYAQGVRPDR